MDKNVKTFLLGRKSIMSENGPKKWVFQNFNISSFSQTFHGPIFWRFSQPKQKKNKNIYINSDTSQLFCGSLFLSSVRVPVGQETCRTMICSQVTCDQEFVILWFETFRIICQIANLSSSMIKIDSTLMTLRGRLDFVSVTVPGITVLLASSSPVWTILVLNIFASNIC